MAYNLPDVVKLNLSGDVIADIYAGKITDWNDARLQKLNRMYSCGKENHSGIPFRW